MARKAKLSIVSTGKKKSNGIISARSSGKYDIELGGRLRLRRVEQKMSQSELADKLGVSFQQVQKYEKGVNRIGASRLQQIATALDVPVTFFFDDDGLGKRASDGKREVESLGPTQAGFSEENCMPICPYSKSRKLRWKSISRPPARSASRFHS